MSINKHAKNLPQKVQTPLLNQQQLKAAALLVLAIAVVLNPDVAHAATTGSEWDQVFVEFINTLRSKGAKVIIAIGGLGLTIYFGYGAVSGDVPWKRVGYAIVGTLGALFIPDGLATMIGDLQ